MQDQNLLEVENLRVHFPTREGVVQAVEGVDFAIKPGTTLGLVGESGSGKSVTAYALLQAVARPGKIVSGRVLLRQPSPDQPGQSEIIDLAALDPRGRKIRSIRGKEIAMIYQEPMTSLSMMHTVGFQIMEAILLHQDVDKAEARRQAIDMLGRVGIPRPEQRVDAYAFELSGGMRQRAMIAMALVCAPRLLIADEPTTALDVTTQAQIMELMLELQREMDMAVLLITHDLGVVAETCQEVVVMYLGEVMEKAGVISLFQDPLHPYTRALLRSIPRLGQGRSWDLEPIEGMVPDPYNRPSGCPFHPRCSEMIPGVCDARPLTTTQMPDGRSVRCHLYTQPKR
ncbi:MAG: dipeptide/oligopeptide/nickel ABC transporter ATP-binding protein [Chloroflexi bacterium]|nr:MAG: dipeptide/oligopeptide/nickel ABC transporter ATP-binding protein [Chloroflexota bacterium]